MPTYTGNNNNNTLTGSTGADDFYGNGGQDTINAGAGNDTAFGGNGQDSINGQAGDDILYGDAGNDRLFGGTENDTLYGGTGNDSLDGGSGNDLLEGGAGNDTLIGGSGIDTVDYSIASGAVTVNLTTGTGGSGPTDIDSLTGIENVIGSSFADTITGDGADNTITSGDGADQITTGSGSDTVYGGDGDDVIDTGAPSLTAVDEDFNWSLTGADEADISGGVTQDTGNVSVSVTFTDDGNATEFSVESSSSVYIGGGETFSTTSNLYLAGTGSGNTSTTRIDFAPESGFEAGVRNVQFRLNDIDMSNGNWQDMITILAYDPSGALIPVTFTMSGNDTVSGNTITATNTSDSATSINGSALITIAGPVAWFTIDYDNTFTSGQLIYVSDIQFDATPVDNDVVDGGAGNDVISTGVGNDSLIGGTGNDSLNAGDGNDTLDGGDDNDTLDAGAGEDLLSGGAGDDLLYGGNGNDTIYFGADDDTVYGGAGNDLIDDVATGSLSGANLIYGGDGNDTVWSGLGDDTIYGDAGNDVLSGEDGNDLLDGGTGNDQVFGEAGNDSLTGGAGADTLYGGNDRDLFTASGTSDDFADVVEGGGSGDDLDTLDLSAWGKALTNIYKDPTNPENGYVEFLDAFGAVIGLMSFTDIETIIPCFTPGTRIATDRGEVAVEALRPGDLVMTRDHGYQPIRWVGRKDLSFAQLIASPALRPVRIAAGAMGLAQPARDLIVSPQHRVLFEGPWAEMLFGDAEVLVAAAHLEGRPGVDRPVVRGVSYIHLMFDRHEIVCSNGCWSESFQPAARMVGAMDNDGAAEILALFPDLPQQDTAFPAARLTLKAHEARVLLAA